MGCDVSESLLLDTARVLVDTGLRDLGYKYVILDDCWSAGRNKQGKLEEDREKFPSGMAAVVNEVHEQGLLFGMYSSAGEMTCARFGKEISDSPRSLSKACTNTGKLAPLTLSYRMRRALQIGELTTSSMTTATTWGGWALLRFLLTAIRQWVML